MNTGNPETDAQDHIANQVDRDEEIMQKNEAFDAWYAEECERINNQLKQNK